MKIAYLLDCYDVLLRQVKSNVTVPNKVVLNELVKKEDDSYRIYKITIIKREGTETIKISKPKHSFHPEVQRLELKTLFHFNEFEDYIPRLKNLIDFTGETILFAKNKQSQNTFYVYEKCTISELNPKERFFLYCNQVLMEENQNIKLYQFSEEYNKIDCLKTIYSNLEKLLLFIEQGYNNYLNVNIMVPHRTVLINEYEIKPKLDFVRDSLLAKVVNSDLLKILFEPILLLSTINIQNKITYYQFNYAKEYVMELSLLLNENSNEVNDSDIAEWLLDLNMNSIRFFDYKTNVIQKELEQCESDIDQLELLYKKLKKFNQHRSKIIKAFNHKLPDSKVQICNWLEEEINFINIKRNIGYQQMNTNKTVEPTNKILIGLSVAQISYFVNILMKTGIIKHSNQRDIFRMIADNFKTNGTDNISIDSLSSKFYNVETSTKNTIKEKIIELLNLTK